MITNKEVIGALRNIAKAHDGFLRAEDVVEAARTDASPLHSYFTWEDTEAAQHWRLFEAQRLIRVVVAVIPGITKDPVRVFMSLKSDRTPIGGYRTSVEILSNAQMREQMVREALDDMQMFRERYRMLRELADVFASMRKAAKKLAKKKSA